MFEQNTLLSQLNGYQLLLLLLQMSWNMYQRRSRSWLYFQSLTFRMYILLNQHQVMQTSLFTLLLMRVWKPIYLWLTWLMCLRRLSGCPSASLRCSQSMMLWWPASTPKVYVCPFLLVSLIFFKTHLAILIMYFFHAVVCRKGP